MTNNFSAGAGGGGGGGGVLIYGANVTIKGRIDARGRIQDTLSTINGGTVKIFYEALSSPWNIQAGRIYSNGRPRMQGLISPLNGSQAELRTDFAWKKALDPEGDNITYELQVSTSQDFGKCRLDVEGIQGQYFVVADDLMGNGFFWRARARDSIGYGSWSEVGRFYTDKLPPVTHVNSMQPFINRTSFEVSWSGTDDVSGVARYTIYEAEDNGTFHIWQDNTTNISETFRNAKEGVKYSFLSKGIDRGNNSEALRKEADACVTVDLTPPVSGISSLSFGDGPAQILVKWSGEDSLSGIFGFDIFVADGAEPFTLWQRTTLKTSAVFQGEGMHEYSFYSIAIDNAGNREAAPDAAKIKKIRIDTAAPVTTLQIGEPRYGQDPIYVTTLTSFVLKAVDEFPGVKKTMYSIDDREPVEFQLSIKESIPGYHNLTYWSEDKAGNIEEQGRLFFFVDREAPVTAVRIDGPNYDSGEKIYAFSTTSFSLTSIDGGCGFPSTKVNIDYRGYVEYSTALKFNTSGSHTITYRSVDILGNIEAEKTLNIVLDTQPPVTKASADRTLSNMDIHIVFNANDSASGVNRTFFRITREKTSAGDYQVGMTATVEAAPDGSGDENYTVEYYSADELNNTEPARKFFVTIDTQVFLKLDFSGTPTVDKDRFTISGRTEPGAKMKIGDSNVAVSSDGRFSHEVGLSPGMNHPTITITDSAGNDLTRIVDIDYRSSLIAAGGFQTLLAIALIAIACSAGISLFFLKRKGHAGKTRKQMAKKPKKRIKRSQKQGGLPSMHHAFDRP